ncbi:MAG TPA: endonuclease/exonuclease/phosphatase family protein [Bryobacteraceae bacterium]|nr:endonuclease/exonuclease/phosphatase family protein [Bryobacteraceae bacterium]
MLTFLFWNINRKPLADAIATIAEQESVDLLILAECAIEDSALLKTLNRRGPEFHFPSNLNSRIKLFTRFPGRYLVPSFDSDRVSIRRVALPAREEILLVAVHLSSKLYWSAQSQAMECPNLSTTITEQERLAGHNRSVVVGDFNMNPFEDGIVGAGGLHAVMSRKVAERGERIVQGRAYPFFYNPMWGHLGDSLDRPTGSYYYERAEHVNYFWNTFDQVLLRPALMGRFRNDQLKILDRAGDLLLRMPDGRPDPKAASDHFPLLFRLDL